MKKCALLLSLIVLFRAASAFGQVHSLVPNDSTTGTVLNELAKINTSGNAILASTSDTTVATYIVADNSGKTGNADLILNGANWPCVMDISIAGSMGYFVIASTSTAGECHPQANAPAAGVWVVGFLQISYTTQGVASPVYANGFFSGSRNLLPLYAWQPFPDAATNNQGISANQIRVTAISHWTSATVQFSAIDIYVGTADTTGGDVYSFGLYGPCAPGASSCPLVASSTAQAFSSVGFLELTPSQTTPIFIPLPSPGQFYYAVWTGNAATAQINGASGRFFAPVCNALSSTTSSGGALPSTISIPSASWGNCGAAPIFGLHN